LTCCSAAEAFFFSGAENAQLAKQRVAPNISAEIGKWGRSFFSLLVNDLTDLNNLKCYEKKSKIVTLKFFKSVQSLTSNDKKPPRWPVSRNIRRHTLLS